MEFTKEELKMMRQLGIPVPAPAVYKIVRAETKCKLCQSVTVQFIRMIKQGEETWLKERELKESEVIAFQDTLFASVGTCWQCVETLLKKEKEELVRMLIALNSFTQPKEVLKQATGRRKKGDKDEG